MSHKPSDRLPLLSARPAVTPATLKRATTYFAAWWTEAQWVWTVCLRPLPGSVAAAIWTQLAIIYQNTYAGPPYSRSEIYAARISRDISGYRSISAARARPQQQTRRPPTLLQIDGTDRRTDGRTRGRFTTLADCVESSMEWRKQARGQEMKMGGGVFLVKSGPFLNAECIMYSISIFILHFTYLGGCMHPTHPPLPTGLKKVS